jgi:Rab5 GDP/GTP exchange factor
LCSILGPNGDMTPPPNPKKVDYIFYGDDHLDSRCRNFFDSMQEKCLVHPEFKHENEERQIIIRDRLEQYVMNRIADIAFKGVRSESVKEEDELLARRMKTLDFLTAEALDIKPELINETLLAISRDELRRINAFKTPWDKISCVVKSADIIFRSLNLSRAKRDAHFDHVGQDSLGSSSAAAAASGDSSAGYGADDFLPLFIWVVLRSHAGLLASNCEYIYKYLNPARQMGKAGYYLTNLQSAINFVNYVEADSLSIDAELFQQKLAEAEQDMADV